ncbi:MAG: sugar ABC transporter substrate-binding protein [Phycisphaerae bacterium]
MPENGLHKLWARTQLWVWIGLFLTPILGYLWLHNPQLADHKIHLTYMAWGNPEQQRTDEQMLDLFQTQNPDIAVHYLMVPGAPYPQKMQVMLASNTEPDVFRVDLYQLPRLIPMGYFRPLDDFMAADEKAGLFRRADYVPQALNEVSYRGQTYGLNTLFGGKLIYYNKDLFQAAGLTDPFELYQQGHWDIAAFLHAAQTLTRRDKNGRLESLGMRLENLDVWWLIWLYGGEIIDSQHQVYVDQPQAIAGLTFFNDLMHKYRVVPKVGETIPGQLSFETGMLGMTSGFAGESPRYRKQIGRQFNWDVVPIPTGPTGRHALVKGNGLMLSVRSRHPEAGWRLIRFMCGPQAEQAYCGDQLRRAIPTLLPVAASKAYLQATQPPYNVAAFTNLYQDGRQLPVTDRWADWQPILGRWVERLTLQKVTPEEAAKGMAQELRITFPPVQ